MQLSKKQNEYIVNATHRWNIKSGAVRSGKSYVDTAFVIPFRIRERAGLPGLNVILGVSKESIERNVLQPMREIYTDKLIGTINNRNVARICGEDAYCLGAEKVSRRAVMTGVSQKTFQMDVAKMGMDVEIGDIVGGRDYLTGMYMAKPVENIIYEIINDTELKTYKLEGEDEV